MCGGSTVPKKKPNPIVPLSHFVRWETKKQSQVTLLLKGLDIILLGWPGRNRGGGGLRKIPRAREGSTKNLESKT